MSENVLLVYYSRTGHTQMVADALVRKLNCDVEELHDRTSRRGLLGYLRSGFESAFSRETPLVELARNPLAYDLVIVGGPVWNASVSSPIRTFLNRYRGRLARTAFFVTCGGSGAQRAMAKMSECADRSPIAELEVRAADIEGGNLDEKLQAFVDLIEHRAPPSEPIPGGLTPAPV